MTGTARLDQVFRLIEPGFLRSIAQGNIRTPTLYFHPNPLLRRTFWMRLWFIHRAMLRLRDRGGECLDFGGGSGVFLPTLATHFSHVTCIDLDPREALQVRDEYKLTNVSIDRADITDAQYSDGKFDAIVAADVLEHFADLGLPVRRIRQWLAADGLLFTSLPTENWMYTTLRAVFRIKKPADHYHTSQEVETFLTRSGFTPVNRWFVPLGLPIAPLFSITTWRKTQ